MTTEKLREAEFRKLVLKEIEISEGISKKEIEDALSNLL